MSYPIAPATNTTVDLAFSDGSDGSVGPSGAHISLPIAFGAAVVVGGDDLPVTVSGRFTLRGSAFANIDVGVHRGHSARHLFPFDAAVGKEAHLVAPWQQNQSLQIQTTVSSGDSAQPLPVRASTSWSQAARLQTSGRVPWAVAWPIHKRAVAPWQESRRHRARAKALWQEARAAHDRAVTHWQNALHVRKQPVAPWQVAQNHSAFFVASGGHGSRPQDIQFVAPWQVAQLLVSTGGPAIVVRPGVVPGLQTVVVPLAFCQPYPPPGAGWPSGNVALNFAYFCPGTQPAGQIVVPVRSVYMVQNSVTLYRMPAGTEFEASSFTLDIDADSWTFGWSASLHRSARAHLVRSPSTERVEVQALINGQAVRLAVDSIGRDRSFPTDRISVSGRGRAAELDEVSLNFDNVAARTAQQLMADVLTVNGVSIGWSVDWQITDWLVPAGAWLHQGSYISALQDIADAAGAYLQPHFTDKVIRVLPRYAQAPWDWATLLTPDIELPVAATTLENTEEVIKPAYNRVFVGGVSMGVFGPVNRDGTAGDMMAPPVTHALITAAEVHRQRGLAVLSDTGVQEHLTLKTLLLPETGIIMPGKVLRYVTEDGPGLGIVRKTNINMSQWPQMHQTLGVETHVE